jgi:hypothetical protein
MPAEREQQAVQVNEVNNRKDQEIVPEKKRSSRNAHEYSGTEHNGKNSAGYGKQERDLLNRFLFGIEHGVGYHDWLYLPGILYCAPDMTFCFFAQLGRDF